MPPMPDRQAENRPIDPLRDIFMKRACVYLALLSIAVLWPFDLFQKNHVNWLPESNGIAFIGKGMLVSPSPASALYKGLIGGQGLTLNVWLAPGNTAQAGLARIVSYSLNAGLRNFTLGQQGKHLIMRLRTTQTSYNGTNPSLMVSDVFHESSPIHIVIMYDFNYQSVYINGKLHTRSQLPGGDFSNWNPACFLVFGNEASGNRPWQGRLFQVSIYNRPLEAEEVGKLYNQGWTISSTRQDAIDSPSKGLLAHYRLDEGSGDQAYDASSHSGAVDLTRPGYLRHPTSRYLRWPRDALANTLRSRDTVFNVIGFIPLGFFLHGALRNRYGPSLRLSVLVLLIGSSLSFGFESMQYFSMSRDSSAVDLITNSLGTLVGVMIDRSYIKSVHRFWANRI